MAFVTTGHMIMSSGVCYSSNIENHSMMMTSSSCFSRFEFAGGLRKISCNGGGGSAGSYSAFASSCSSSCLNLLPSTNTTRNGHRRFLVSNPIIRRKSMVVVDNHHQFADEVRSFTSTNAKEMVRQVILKQAASFVGVGDINNKEIIKTSKPTITSRATTDGDQSHVLTNPNLLNEAYDQCRRYCAENEDSKYLGTVLFTPERQRAIWALYAWCRRTDELVDGPNASVMNTPETLDRWEQRLIDIFQGHPHDLYDAALSDTLSKYPAIDIQLFKDMLQGMRMDLNKSRYKNFDELYLYTYYVAMTGAFMAIPVMGICPESRAPAENVYETATALAIASQLTNILRDVGDDAKTRGRIYLPQDELALAGLSDDDIFRGQVTNKWRNFMKGQIKRARMYYDEAEKGVNELAPASRWSVWASLMLYRQILDAIEANDYNNFTKRASVPHAAKLISVPVAYARGVTRPFSQYNPAGWLLHNLIDEFKFRM